MIKLTILLCGDESTGWNPNLAFSSVEELRNYINDPKADPKVLNTIAEIGEAILNTELLEQ